MQTGACQWEMTNVISVFRLANFQQNDFSLAKWYSAGIEIPLGISNPCGNS